VGSWEEPGWQVESKFLKQVTVDELGVVQEGG
jgi:hypothetical protein